MAIELSYAKGAVKPVAEELGIDPGRLSKWRQRESTPPKKTTDLTEDHLFFYAISLFFYPASFWLFCKKDSGKRVKTP